MERDANYGLIGGLTLALLAAAFGFILWLGQSQFARNFDEYRIIFDGPVRGLSEGGEVQFNGIPVGEITRISLDPRNPNRVLAGVRLREDTPVRVDSTAATESQGITGGSYIQISAGTPSKPLLKEVSKETLPVIKAEKSSLQSLMDGGGALLADASQALERVNRTLSDENIENVSAAIADVRATTAELRSSRGMFSKAEQAFARLDRAAADIEAAAASARTAIDGDGRKTFADVSAAARDLREGSAEARVVIHRLDDAASGLAAPDRSGIAATLKSLDSAAQEIEQLAGQLRRTPRERKLPQ